MASDIFLDMINKRAKEQQWSSALQSTLDKKTKARERYQQSKSASSEHALQVSCVRWFRMQYRDRYLLYATPNGGSRNRIEAAHLREEGVTAGIPDLTLAVAAGGWHGLYIELKNGKAYTTSQAQKDAMQRLTEAGYLCVVVRSIEEFIKTIRDYLAGKNTREQSECK